MGMGPFQHMVSHAGSADALNLYFQSMLRLVKLHPILSAVTAVLVSLYLIERLFFTIKYPTNLPLVREPPGRTRFSFRTRLAYYTDCASVFREAYEKFSKKGKSVLVPGLGSRSEVILPPSFMPWLLAQPDEQLNLGEAFLEVDQANYSFGHGRYVQDAWQGLLVKTEMNAVLERIVASLDDELKYAFDTRFGTDTENWKEIDLLQTIRLIVAQGAARFTVGTSLCRNERYLADSLSVVDGCVLTAGLASMAPRVVRPVLGRLVGLSTRLRIRKLEKMFEPLYRERRQLVEDVQTKGLTPVEPQDHLQMMMRYAYKERPDEFQSLSIMNERVCAANFGSIHQTAIQSTNMLLNIIGSDEEYNTISVLRNEIQSVLQSDSNGATWTKAKVGAMIKADSVARETLRLNSFGNRAVFRKVIRDGVVTPDGVPLPVGSVVSFLSYPPSVDPNNYEEPFKYDPFRFSRAREAAAATDGKAGGTASFVSTSAKFLPFGHGRHACPGRFLVDFELKIIIAYVLSHYDIRFPAEYNGRRPENKWMAEAVVPPPGAKIEVKRRK